MQYFLSGNFLCKNTQLYDYHFDNYSCNHVSVEWYLYDCANKHRLHSHNEIILDWFNKTSLLRM